MNKQNNQSRRNFISTLATSAATAGFAVLANPLKAHSFAVAQPNGDLAAAAEKWLKGLQGKAFPVVYDMHEHKDFWAGIWSSIYMMTNENVKNLGVAIVMRHGGFPFALKDQAWAKYKLGEFFNITDKNTNSASVRNMYYQPKEKDFPLPGLDGVPSLITKGVGIGVCNMALKVYSGFIAQARGFSADEVYNDFVANIIPGIQLVPSGVWALGRLQQAPLSYGYINAG